jgi:hypothetical protein
MKYHIDINDWNGGTRSEAKTNRYKVRKFGWWNSSKIVLQFTSQSFSIYPNSILINV